MGLLTSLFGFSPEQTQGLLGFSSALAQTSGPSLMPTSGAQGLAAALQGYQKGVHGEQDRVLQLEQARQLAQLRDFAIQDKQSDVENQKSTRQRAQDLLKLSGDYWKSGAQPQGASPAFPGGQPAASMLQGVLSAQAGQAQQAPAASGAASGGGFDRGAITNQRLAYAQFLRQHGYGNEAQSEEDSAIKMQPEWNTTPQVVRGPDGNPMLVQTSKDGSVRPMAGGYGVADKLDFRDGGNAIFGLDNYTGNVVSTLKKSQSPDSAAVDRRAAADRAASTSTGGSSGGGASASLDNETLDFLADRGLRGDRSVTQNLGRGAQGAANLVALQQRIAQKAKAQGLTGADVAAINADYDGQKAGLRTSSTISARIENAASEAAQLAPLAVAAGRNVTRSGFLPFGQAQVMFDTKTNDTNLNRFATANVGLATAYASAMARGGKATVSDNQHARDLLSTAKSQDAYEAIVGQMMQEIEAARAAPNHVRENLRGQINGRAAGGGMVPNPVAPATSGGWSIQKVSP